MVRINHADSTHPATASTPVANSARASSMVPAVKSTAGELHIFEVSLSFIGLSTT